MQKFEKKYDDLLFFRAEFKKYLNGLLFTTMTTEGKIRDDYGRSYIDLVTKTKFHKVRRFIDKIAPI